MDYFKFSDYTSRNKQGICIMMGRRLQYAGQFSGSLFFSSLLIGVMALLSISAVATSASAKDTLSRIKETQKITIAHRESSFPFSYLNDNKQPIGYSIDICLRLVDALRRELKLPNLAVNYLLVSSSTRIPAIVAGSADLECGSTTNNAERRKEVSFTIPHFFSSVRMLVRKESGVQNWPDLHDKTVVTTKGSTAVKLLMALNEGRQIGIKVIEASDHAESFKMLESGQAEAFVMDDVLLYGFKAKSKAPEKLDVVGMALSTEPYSIMLAKDDPQFKKFVDHELARMANDGETTKLYNKWFRSPLPQNGVNLNMAMSFLLRDNLRFPSDKLAD